MRIQVELPPSKVADLNWLKEMGGVKTYYDLFNHALSILKWATKEVIEGNAIVSLCEETGKTRYLVTPFLQEAANHAEHRNPTTSASTAQPSEPKRQERSKSKTHGGAAAS